MSSLKFSASTQCVSIRCAFIQCVSFEKSLKLSQQPKVMIWQVQNDLENIHTHRAYSRCTLIHSCSPPQSSFFRELTVHTSNDAVAVTNLNHLDCISSLVLPRRMFDLIIVLDLFGANTQTVGNRFDTIKCSRYLPFSFLLSLLN